IRGSTRLEAKRQRRRDGREAGRRRAPILSESEFLTRREAVERTMVVREHPERTQIGVLEDDVLVEHFVTAAGSGSLVGNVYLGRVQNVLPSMEAAFVDIGRGRNAVLYAGEVDWDAAGLEGKARRIEQALSGGDSVLVQVTKDPVGHKGARLTTQISLPGRFLVYVPGGRATGISRKLADVERKRLKEVLKKIVPEDAGVIIRTASEGVSEEELARDVRRLQAQWEVIQNRSGASANGSGGKITAPELLYEEPDLLVKVVRDLFTEDFRELVVQGDKAWDTVEDYVKHVAPELMTRVRRHTGAGDVFAEFRIDEQITKALDRKVWLPSGGYLIIDRTEAMTVIDVNTGKFTGSGGNLEETVTRNNLEAAEEIIRQLRLRDIGGIIVIDFIDMVLESNRDLVLRRLTECLGRDRTRHQVAEITSLGLVQMTRKKVGTGLLEAYSSTCEHCKGRGVLVSAEPANVRTQGVPAPAAALPGAKALPAAKDSGSANGRRSRSRGRGSGGSPAASDQGSVEVLPAAAAAPLPAPAEVPPAEVPQPPTVTDAPGMPVPPAARTMTRRRRTASRPAGPPAAELPNGADPHGAEPHGVASAASARGLSTPV
ncbi:MAG: Rne/Rng family ribonuclease, partial [Pseudonocardiaceae bacterium]